MRKLWVGLLVATVALASCKSKGKQAKDEQQTLPPEIEMCVQSLEAVQAFAATGLETVELASVKDELTKQLTSIGGSCKAMYKNPACAEAVSQQASILSGGQPWLDSCKDAYCADLDPAPAACSGADSPSDHRQLLVAIWSKDWGEDVASSLRDRLDALELGPAAIADQLMAQVEKKLGKPIQIDLANLEQLPAQQPSIEQHVVVEMTGTGFRIEPPSGEVLEAADLDALIDQLGSLVDAGLDKATTGIRLVGTKASYQDLIDAMDRLTAAGFPYLAVGRADGDKNESSPNGSTPSDLGKAPVIVITPDTVMVGGTSVGKVADMTKPGGIDTLIGKLTESHPGGGMVIIQADKDTEMAVLVAILDQLKQHDFTDVNFAVRKSN